MGTRINTLHLKDLFSKTMELAQHGDSIFRVDRIVLAEKAYSDVPADSYLTIVLCWLPDNDSTPFAVWTRNHAEGCQGDSTGHYCRNISEAVEIYNEKGV